MDKKFDTFGLSYIKLYQLISDDQAKEIETISTSSMEKPWLIDVLLYYLSDSNPLFTMYPQDIVIKLAELMIDYYHSSWSAFFDINNGDIDLRALIEYKQQDRFMIDAANGMRVATKNEVDEGIYNIADSGTIGLVNDPVNKIEDSEYKFICLFLWTVTGLWRYYIRAGYTVEFDTNSKVKEPEIKYISSIRHVLFRMCELLKDDSYYTSIINKLKHIKKLGTYKYPSYAADEVMPDEKISFVINQVERLMTRRKSPLIYECHLILRRASSKSTKSFSTQDKMTLRKGLYELRHPEEFNGEAVEQAEIDEIREMCEKIRQGVINKHLGENEFAVKVASTIMKNNYRRCSAKQRAVLVDAINKIKSNENRAKQTEILNKAIEKNEETPVDSGFSLADMSDLLGKGLMI